MKTLLKTLFVASAITSMSAAAAVVTTTGNEASFTFEGTIQPMCKTDSGSNSVTNLNLDATQETQEIGTLDVWCNTGKNAVTEYSSANGGYLMADNQQKSKIAYTLDIGTTAGVDLQNGTYRHLTTLAGTGTSGETQATALKITPQSNGLDDAGTYSDTITVTVSPN
ncbi:hypothetical protein [Pseudoalteromonas piscicida]|uniref:Spore coat protein U domain-containing protein n=1 Tax=Pseudoalteromonas piscicida TaxID=43662 RepID=A0A2A5JQG8_PSEO7|nr:hypothetical protein [Pseudoalteromonas piscicida]PCK31675.1 hypothetical protein CEX98_11185 [Pseudoalteromonas piscicida]